MSAVRVAVVGLGMIGGSVARRLAPDHDVRVWDTDPGTRQAAERAGLRVADDLGAVDVVVVATPLDAMSTVLSGLSTGDRPLVTDVGSVKVPVLAAARAAGLAGRYVGGHPMAGSERSGPLAASAALFDGRPWAVTPHQDSSREAVDLVLELVAVVGATAVQLSPDEHDRAVARTSHLPHLLASLVAGRLAEAPPGHLALSGQGVRDVTRVAAGDPELWQQIVSGNAPAVVHLLGEVRDQLDALIVAVSKGQRAELTQILAQGVAGTQAIPGKHGGPPRATASVFVSVPDRAGELARLFADAGSSGVNIEDVRIDHDPGRPTGLVELVVADDSSEHLLASLESRGWVTHR